MTRLTGAAILVLLLAGLAAAPATQRSATPEQGQPLKLAYIDSRLILANTPGRAEAESTFTREYAVMQVEVQRMQQQLDSSIQEYNRTSLVLSPAAKQQRESDIRQMEQRTRQRAAELEQRAGQREQELTAPIMRRVNAVIEGIRAEFNYSMIFDAAAQGGSLVTADRSLDISPLVIRRLQASGPAPAQRDTTTRPLQPRDSTVRPPTARDSTLRPPRRPPPAPQPPPGLRL